MNDFCPACGYDGEMLEICDKCGAQLVSGKSFNGYCYDCARSLITYRSGFDFLQASNELVEFVFSVLYGVFVPIGLSEEDASRVNVTAGILYDKKVCADLINGETRVLDALADFILGDDDTYGAEFVSYVLTEAEK